ncbi:MAG: LPS translocon maturation chaperone LptM [Burkholderiaceae bacterium]|jgi:predicted small lipoprotein YifL
MRKRAAILCSDRPAAARLWRVSLAAVGLCALLSAAGCGQKGPLVLPTDPAAAQRATLPETLSPARRNAPSTP